MIKDLIDQRLATERSWNRLQENIDREWGLYGHDMGIHDLNLMLGGWVPTKVTTIAARSGIGKTAILTPMIEAGSRLLNGRRAEFLFFTWEMEPSYIIDRHICSRVGCTLKHLNQGAKLLGEHARENIRKAYNEALGFSVTYQDYSINIDEVSALVIEFVQKCKEKEQVEGVKIQPVVLVDYISMAQFEGSGLRTHGIAQFMNGIKQIANSTGAAFCLLAQINRSADDKDIPQRNDLTDSQSIEMASDNLVLLHRPEYNNIKTIEDPETNEPIDSRNKMLVRVLKGRDYGVGDRLINVDIGKFRFWSLDHDYGDPYYDLYGDENFWKKHFKIENFETTPNRAKAGYEDSYPTLKKVV
jgi:replicative DNA helicase